MLMLVKYELRRKLVTILGICLTMMIGNLFLLTKLDSWQMGVPILSTFLGVGGLILIFISSLTLLGDYLYNEQGYLLFTLPQSGVALLTSRLLAAVMQISMVTMVGLVMFCVIDQGKILNALLRHVQGYELVYSILLYLWTIISVLTFIYFCMVVGKIALKGKKVGKIGSFILFFLLGMGWKVVTFVISNFFPQVVQLDSLATITINVGSAIAESVIFVLLFMTTSYLLEHKVDL